MTRNATRKTLLAAASVATLFAPGAMAGEAFVGAGGGRADWPGDVCANASSCDRHATAWYAKGGYMVLPWIGIEGRYVDLGRAKAAFAQPNITFESRYEVRGPGVGAIVAFPLAPDFSVNAVAGVMRQRFSVEQPDVTIQSTGGEAGSITAVGFRGSTTKTKPYYGVGVDMRIATNLSVGVDLTRYRLEGADIDTLTGGLTYRFR